MRWATWILAGGLLTACFTKPDGPPLPDAAAPFDPGFLHNGDFELGCVSWNDYYSEIRSEPVGRSGTRSCRVCRSGVDYYYLAQDVSRPFVPGERYLATVWIRQTDDQPTGDIHIVMELHDDASATVDLEEGSRTTATGTWTEVSAVLQISATSGTNLVVRAGASYSSAADECFLVDDASLHKLP
jgi:hypothetical protein